MQTPLHGHVGLNHHHPFLKAQDANEVKEEAFSASEAPHNNAESGSALLDAVQIGQERGHLLFAPHLDKVQS